MEMAVTGISHASPLSFRVSPFPSKRRKVEKDGGEGECCISGLVLFIHSFNSPIY